MPIIEIYYSLILKKEKPTLYSYNTLIKVICYGNCFNVSFGRNIHVVVSFINTFVLNTYTV